MGLHAPLCPSMHVARNVPAGQQTTAVGIVTAASYAGTALAFGVSPLIISRLGWEVSVLLLLYNLYRSR